MADSSGVKAGRAYVSVGADNSELLRVLKQSEARMRAFGAGIQAVGIRMSAAGSAIVAPMLHAAKTAADLGRNAIRMSEETGISIESLSKLKFAAAQAGTSEEELSHGIFHMSRFLGEVQSNSSSAAAALGNLGLTIADVKDLKPEEALGVFADAINRLPNSYLKAERGGEVFGKGVLGMLPFLKQGKAGMNAYGQQLEKAGGVMTKEAAEEGQRLAVSMDLLHGQFQRAYVSVGSALVPALTELAKVIVPMLTSVSQWFKANEYLTRSLALAAAAVTTLGITLAVLSKLSFVATISLGILAMAVKAVTFAVGLLYSTGALPFVLMAAGAVAAIGGIVVLLAYLQRGSAAFQSWGSMWGSMKSSLVALGETFKTTWGGILDSLMQGDIALAGKIGWLGLQVAGLQALGLLKKAWIDFSGFFVDAWESATTGVALLLVSLAQDMQSIWQALVKSLGGMWDDMILGLKVGFADVVALARRAAGVDEDVIAGEERSSKALAVAENRLSKNRRAAEMAKERGFLVDVERELRVKNRTEQEGREKEREAQKEEIDNDEDLMRLAGELAAARDTAAGMNKAHPHLSEAAASVPIISKTDVMGTFSAAAVGGLGVGHSLEERQIQLQKQIEANTKSIAEQMRGMGLIT